MVAAKRKKEIQYMVKTRILDELEDAYTGQSEGLMKEAWEHCEDEDELAFADLCTRKVAAWIRKMP